MRAAKSDRHRQIMAMKASPPSLSTAVRKTPYLDYQKLSLRDRRICDQLIDNFIQRDEIECLDSAQYFKIMIVLRERRRVLTLQNRLDDCFKIDECMQQLSAFFLENQLYTSKEEEVAAADAQLEAERRRLEVLEEQHAQNINALKTQQEIDTQRIKDMCEQRLNQYDGSIPGDLPIEFSKLSPEMLNLKEQEKHLIISRRFKEAAELHKEFEKKLKQEMQLNKERYAKSFEFKRKELETRNSKKLNAVDTRWSRKVSHAEFIASSEINPLRGGVNNLEHKLVSRKSEYIGEDDDIVRRDDRIRTLASTTRPTLGQQYEKPTKQLATSMRLKNQKLPTTRWPPEHRE